MFVLNIVTKYWGDPRIPPHSGHFTCFMRTDSWSRSRPSVSVPVASLINWSALNLRWQMVHSVIGSLKFWTCPEVSRTRSGVMIGVDISTNPCRLRKNSLHVSSISRFRPVPRGPRSMKPLTPPYISKEPQKKPLRRASSESNLCLSRNWWVG